MTTTSQNSVKIGALFWEAGQLHASLTDQKKADLVTNAIAQAHDPQLDRAVVVSKGKLTQEQLEDYQSDAIALYQEEGTARKNSFHRTKH